MGNLAFGLLCAEKPEVIQELTFIYLLSVRFRVPLVSFEAEVT